MKRLVQQKLFKFLVLVACMAASKITWFGTYEAEVPQCLSKIICTNKKFNDRY